MKKSIVLKNGIKEYNLKNEKILAMNNIDLEINLGKLYVIMGHSGSGKSTLIQILGLLDTLTEGMLYINGLETSSLSEDEKAEIRMKEIGNVILPMYINNEIPKVERKKRALMLLKNFGLENRINHYPKELSGGEQQRIAIARALVNNPNFILADEPTGNLDVKNEEIVYNSLKSLALNGKAVVVVSHNENIKKYADEIYYMEDGKLRK